MLLDPDSYRPDTHYQISLKTNESRNLSVLKDRLDQILMKKVEDPQLDKMKMDLKLVKYLTESLKIVDIRFDNKKSTRFLLSFAEINYKAYISLF